MELEPYIMFDGNCEPALDFYKRVFGGEVTSLNRYAGSPMEGNIPSDWSAKIMHANFKSPSLAFMGADSTQESGASAGRVKLSLSTRDLGEAERIFNALADGGNITMPLEDTFWGAKFGMVSDRFGIQWMVNCQTS